MSLFPYPFTAIVGQEQLKLALIISAVDPAIGGVLISGEKGTAKSTAVRGLAFAAGRKVIEVPLNVTEASTLFLSDNKDDTYFPIFLRENLSACLFLIFSLITARSSSETAFFIDISSGGTVFLEITTGAKESSFITPCGRSSNNFSRSSET